MGGRRVEHNGTAENRDNTNLQAGMLHVETTRLAPLRALKGMLLARESMSAAELPDRFWHGLDLGPVVASALKTATGARITNVEALSEGGSTYQAVWSNPSADVPFEPAHHCVRLRRPAELSHRGARLCVPLAYHSPSASSLGRSAHLQQGSDLDSEKLGCGGRI